MLVWGSGMAVSYVSTIPTLRLICISSASSSRRQAERSAAGLSKHYRVVQLVRRRSPGETVIAEWRDGKRVKLDRSDLE